MGAARTFDGTRGQSGHPLAELHRRVRLVRDSVVALAFVLAGIVAAPIARAQEVDLAALEQGLASDDPSARREAIAGYDRLSATDLPAMHARMERLLRPALPTDDVTRIVTAFRHAVGSRRADDLVDVAPGIPTVLEQTHDRPTVRLAAAILLERAGERIDGVDALRLVPELMRFGGDGMRLEGRRITMRLDARLAAVAIVAAGSPDRESRTWGTWTAERFGTGEPGRFVPTLEPELVPDVLRAYASAHVMSAVSIAISFVDSEHRAQREAARDALEGYGQSSIWVAREEYRRHTGQDASRDWSWRRTLDELFAVLDHERGAVAEPHLARAEQALDAGDRTAARSALDEALAALPAPSDERAAAIALRLAEMDLAASDATHARSALARTRRLPLAEASRARRDALDLFLRADAMLANGALDADQYRAAAALDPSCEACATAAAPLVEPDAPGAPASRSTLPLWLAAAIFLIVAVLFWPSDLEEAPAEPEAPPPADASLPDA